MDSHIFKFMIRGLLDWCYLLSRSSVSSVGWTSTSLSWSVTKLGISIVVVVECVAAIFALVDVCTSIGIAFIIGDLLRSCIGDDSLGN